LAGFSPADKDRAVGYGRSDPPLDSSGRTRLVPPKPEYRAQLKRLYLQKNWTELVEQASQMYCEGVNHFWLDLQWYLWQGLSHAGQPWDTWTDSVLFDLRLLLKRLPGLEGLAWNDGTPLLTKSPPPGLLKK
jgi:type VI secretion system protein VasJ